jgi:epoxide hydrolase 4
LLRLSRPALVSHDWGGALGWIFAHRYPNLIRKLVVVNCTHPRTLARAVLELEDFQTCRSFYVMLQILWVPELLLTTVPGRKLLEFSCGMLEGRSTRATTALMKELISRFQKPKDIRGPINYYRQLVLSEVVPAKRAKLNAVYRKPITVPTTLVWGQKDWVLSEVVAEKSLSRCRLPGGFPPAARRWSFCRVGGTGAARGGNPPRPRLAYLEQSAYIVRTFLVADEA